MMIHLIAEVGDKRTVCGLKDDRGPAVPYMLARYQQAHIDGHARAGREIEFCPDCQSKAPPANLEDDDGCPND